MAPRAGMLNRHLSPCRAAFALQYSAPHDAWLELRIMPQNGRVAEWFKALDSKSNEV